MHMGRAGLVIAVCLGAGAGANALAVSDAVLEQTPLLMSGGQTRGMCFGSASKPEGPVVPGQPPPAREIIDGGVPPCPTTAKHHTHLCLRGHVKIVATVAAQAKELDFIFYGPGRRGVQHKAAPADGSGVSWQFRAPGHRNLNGMLNVQVIYPDTSVSGWSLPICRHT